MRNWINLFETLLDEVRRQDGVWKNPSARDLATLAREKDMRGVAVGNDIWLDYAYEDTHFGLRGRLGLPGESYAGGGDEQDGFNFYVCHPRVASEFSNDQTDQDWEENQGGRNDWVSVGDRKPNFQVDGAYVYVDCHDRVALSNRAFARMVGGPASI